MGSDISTDVIVVGAGVVGASCAYHLAGAGLQVTVVENFDGPAQGSTGRSFASIRAQWADPLNIELSWRSICQFRSFVSAHDIDVGYRPSGYLLLVPDAAWEAQLTAVDLQREHGVPVEVLDAAAAACITPFTAAGIARRDLGPSRRSSRSASGDDRVPGHGPCCWRPGPVPVPGHRDRRRLRIRQLDGDRWRAHPAWPTCRERGRRVAGELAALAGLAVPVVHSRRNIYATAPGALAAALPMTIDLGTGVYMRTEGLRLLFGGARPDQADGYDVSVDWPWMESVLEIAVARFPWLAGLPLDRAACWAGTYENSPDHHGILGADPAAPTWINACGSPATA